METLQAIYKTRRKNHQVTAEECSESGKGWYTITFFHGGQIKAHVSRLVFSK